MMSSLLSQEEIDALLNDTLPVPTASDENALSAVEEDTLGEIANISMGTAATALSNLLGKRVDITTPDIGVTNVHELRRSYPKPYVVVDVNYNTGLKGSNILIVKTNDAGVIVDLMMGGDGSSPPQDLNDLHLSAISEAMNQMMGSACTSLSQVFKKRIDISPPILDIYSLDERELMGGDAQVIVKISFRVVIQDLVDSEMMQIIPIHFAKEMVTELLYKDGKSAVKKAPEAVRGTTPTVPPVYAEPGLTPLNQQVTVSPVQFSSFSAENGLPPSPPPNLGLILDVGLQLSVELGRTHKKIKDILELNIGSIVELDKLAGEPVELLVNGKLIAKGEVVVIDENFGVRVTEIISPIDRVKNLNS